MKNLTTALGLSDEGGVGNWHQRVPVGNHRSVGV